MTGFDEGDDAVGGEFDHECLVGGVERGEEGAVASEASEAHHRALFDPVTDDVPLGQRRIEPIAPSSSDGPGGTTFEPRGSVVEVGRLARLTRRASANVVAGFASPGSDPGLDGDDAYHEGDERVGPPEAEGGVRAKTDEDCDREVGTKDVLGSFSGGGV